MIYQLGNNTFSGKESIIKYFQKFHHNHAVGTLLPNEQRLVMIDLIKWHPEYDTWDVDDNVEFKIGKDGWGNKNYWVKKTNGEWEMFSYRKCKNAQSKEKNQRKNVQAAARSSIRAQIDNHRIMNPDCVLCGVSYSLDDASKPIEVDHDFEQLTFQTILDNYLNEVQKKYTDFQLEPTPFGHRFNEADDISWSNYHQEHAILRSLCRECHAKGPGLHRLRQLGLAPPS